MNPYIVIPIFTDVHLHPLHKDNHLSLLYVKELNKDPEILTFNHLDALSTSSLKSLKDKTLITPNKKHLLSVYPFKTIYDASLLNYFLFNVPLSFDDIRVEAVDIFNSRYYDIRQINAAIPIYKHLEYYDQVAERIEEVWNKRKNIDWDTYEQYNKEAILAFYSIERNGIKVSDNVLNILDKRVNKHLSNGRLYTDYFLCTSAGRPSNSFGSVNFAALDKNKRKAIVPDNDMLIEYDYDAFHVRLIGDIVGYKFPEGSAHKHLARYYGKDVSYEKSKARTFQYLYGMIPLEVVQLNPYFGKVSDLADILWDEFETQGFVETPIYKRKILASNLQDMNKNKLLNYLIQAFETEHNIKTIISIQQYLYKKRTKLVLYGYDSFLFDISNKDGNETLNDIKNILEQDKFLTKSKRGMNYGDMF